MPVEQQRAQQGGGEQTRAEVADEISAWQQSLPRQNGGRAAAAATWGASLPPVRGAPKAAQRQAPHTTAADVDAPRSDQLVYKEDAQRLLGDGGLRMPGPAPAAAGAGGRPLVQEVTATAPAAPAAAAPAPAAAAAAAPPPPKHASARVVEMLERHRGAPEEEKLRLAEQARLCGNESFRAGDTSDAVDSYTLAIGLAPSDARLYANRAAAFMKLKRWRDTLADADAAAALEPRNVKALLRRAEALRNLGRRGEALECLDTVDRLQPGTRDSANMRRHLGQAPPAGKPTDKPAGDAAAGAAALEPRGGAAAAQVPAAAEAATAARPAAGAVRIPVEEGPDSEDDDEEMPPAPATVAAAAAEAAAGAMRIPVDEGTASELEGDEEATEPAAGEGAAAAARGSERAEAPVAPAPAPAAAVPPAAARAAAAAQQQASHHAAAQSAAADAAADAAAARAARLADAADSAERDAAAARAEAARAVESVFNGTLFGAAAAQGGTVLDIADVTDADEGLVQYKELVKRLRARGAQALEQGWYEAAASWLSKALEVSPDCAQAYGGRALAYLRLRRWQDAARDASLALAHGGPEERAAALHKRGLAKRGLGDLKGAQADLLESVKVLAAAGPSPLRAEAERDARSVVSELKQRAAAAKAAAAANTRKSHYQGLVIEEHGEDDEKDERDLEDKLEQGQSADARAQRQAAAQRDAAVANQIAWQRARGAAGEARSAAEGAARARAQAADAAGAAAQAEATAREARAARG